MHTFIISIKKHKILYSILLIAVIALIISMFFIFSTLLEYGKAAVTTEGLRNLKETLPIITTTDESGTTKELTAYEKYKKLHELNEDMVGWIEIKGTNIDHPVVQSTYEPEYYLYRDFYGNGNSSGTPFAQANCAVGLCGNTIIYGHNMSNGTVFSELTNYTSKEYADKHPYIQFDTVTKYGTYQIVAAFAVDAASDEFPFWEYLCSSDEELLEYAELCKQYSYYDTELEVEVGDKLISLVTCEYTHKQGRLVVVAKEISCEK